MLLKKETAWLSISLTYFPYFCAITAVLFFMYWEMLVYRVFFLLLLDFLHMACMCVHKTLLLVIVFTTYVQIYICIYEYKIYQFLSRLMDVVGTHEVKAQNLMSKESLTLDGRYNSYSFLCKPQISINLCFSGTLQFLKSLGQGKEMLECIYFRTEH